MMVLYFSRKMVHIQPEMVHILRTYPINFWLCNVCDKYGHGKGIQW